MINTLDANLKKQLILSTAAVFGKYVPLAVSPLPSQELLSQEVLKGCRLSFKVKDEDFQIVLFANPFFLLTLVNAFLGEELKEISDLLEEHEEIILEFGNMVYGDFKRALNEKGAGLPLCLPEVFVFDADKLEKAQPLCFKLKDNEQAYLIFCSSRCQ